MEEKVMCQICKKEFKNKAGLAGHMAIVHGQNSGSKAKENDSGCQHIWRRLSNAELQMIDEQTGQSIYQMGYLFVCRDCGELR